MKESQVQKFYRVFRERLKEDEKEDVSDLQFAINSADLISKELAKHDFDQMVIRKQDAKLAKDLAVKLNADIKGIRKRYNMLKRLIKEK